MCDKLQNHIFTPKGGGDSIIRAKFSKPHSSGMMRKTCNGDFDPKNIKSRGTLFVQKFWGDQAHNEAKFFSIFSLKPPLVAMIQYLLNTTSLLDTNKNLNPIFLMSSLSSQIPDNFILQAGSQFSEALFLNVATHFLIFPTM